MTKIKSYGAIGASLLVLTGSLQGADVSLTVGNQSWLNAVWGSPAAMPVVGNHYFTATGVSSDLVRTSPAGSTVGGNANFPGETVTVVSGTRFLIKQGQNETASIKGGAGHLIVEGGRVSFAPNGSANSAVLDVNEFRVAATAGALVDVGSSTLVSTIDGTLTGSGDLLIAYGDGTASSGRSLVIASVGSYSGKITLDEGMTLVFGSGADFGGALEIRGNSVLNVTRALHFGAGKLSDSVNGVVPDGIYSGTSLGALGTNYGNGGGTLIVGNVSLDSDADGLPDSYEQRIIDQDPHDAVTSLAHVAGPAQLPVTTDFDADGSSDAEEHATGTDPTNPDTDGDGLSDGSETTTDPRARDSDHDGFGDGRELAAGSNPLHDQSMPTVDNGNPRSLPALVAEAGPESFPVLSLGAVVPIIHDAADAKVVEIAANLLADDLEAVGGVRPLVLTNAGGVTTPAILAGTVGESPLIDGLMAAGKIDVSDVRGNWESYRLERVLNPLPGIPEALVIAGSDRRGTAYGLGSLSEAMGISPWTWWADVPAPARNAIHVTGLPLDSIPPSVRLRGIFINDEDWGLQEWAEKTYEAGTAEVKDIGPKTYGKIFELLLRLRANYCWPAMHPSTRAFHYYAGNRQVADDYAIVMGSSHAEPMLRNNVDEWYRFTADNGYSDNWNYSVNGPVIREYWDTRVQEAGAFENTYSIGKRGIHDSGMVEGSSTAEKAAWLNTIFTDQRQILANRVDSDPARVPQIFVPYKEVLDIYDSGLVNVPADVTLVWPDDNHGYIRRLSNTAEQQRAGGSGIYYHLSYWGAPQDYLWLATIPPALIWEEMTKAYENRCHRLWVFNVGDIKPAEATMEFSLRLAWNVRSYGPDSQMAWLKDWAGREFGTKHAGAIASLLNDYFLLNHRRKPEHMSWTDSDAGSSAPLEGNAYPLFSQVHEGDEVADRLARFEELRQRADAIFASLPPDQRDAFYQLAVYPVRGSEAMTRKFLHTARAQRAVAQKRKTAALHSAEATAAYNQIAGDTAYYNGTMASGKWNEMMDWRPRGLTVFNLPGQPADPGTQSIGLGVAVEGRLSPVFTGAPAVAVPPIDLHAVDDAILSAPMQEATLDGRRCIWTPGSGGVAAAGAGGRAIYTFSVPQSGTYAIKFEVRTPNVADDSWWIQLDGSAAQAWNDLGANNPLGWRWQTWRSVSLSAGTHTLVIHEREDGAAISAIRISQAGASLALGEDDRFNDFRLPEFTSVTRRSYFIDLINSNAAPIAWQATTSDPWVRLSATSGSLDLEQRLRVSIDWELLPAGENLASSVQIHHNGTTVAIPVTVWNPASISGADFIEENGAVVMEAEHPTSSTPGAVASWTKLPGLGLGDGAMIVQPTTAPSLTTPSQIFAQAPSLEYAFYLRTPGTHRIEADFLPALSLNKERGRRYAVSVDGGTPAIVSLSSESGSGGIWSRSVVRSSIKGNSTHAFATRGKHTVRMWMVDPGLVLDRVSILTAGAPYTYHGLRETAVDASEILIVEAGETAVLSDGPARFRKIINRGTLEVRSSQLAIDGDLINFGTFRVTGGAAVNVGGNTANFGWVDSMTWSSPSLSGYSDLGSVLDSSHFHIERHWRDAGSFMIEVPGYSGHRYTLQRSSSLDGGDWTEAGTARLGEGSPGNPVPLTFEWPMNDAKMFFRVVAD